MIFKSEFGCFLHGPSLSLFFSHFSVHLRSKVVELDPVLAPAPPPSVASARNPLEETGSAASFVRNESKPATFRLGGDGGCAEGFHLVTDEESCQVGAKFFKKPFAGSMDAGHEPAGCLLRKADNDVIFNLAESSKPGSRQRQQLCFDRPPGKLPSRPSAPRAGPQPRGSTVPSVPSGTALVSEIGNLTMAPSCGEVEGAVQIRHPNRCQIAAAAYGKKYIGIMKSFLEPHGCLHRKFDQDMMFNRLQTNVTKKDRELVCSSEADPEVPLSRAALSPLEAQKMRIYCFGWTVRRPQEELLLPYARKLYEGCDSHHFFTDTQSAGAEQPEWSCQRRSKTVPINSGCS